MGIQTRYNYHVEAGHWMHVYCAGKHVGTVLETNDGLQWRGDGGWFILAAYDWSAAELEIRNYLIS